MKLHTSDSYDMASTKVAKTTYLVKKLGQILYYRSLYSPGQPLLRL